MLGRGVGEPGSTCLLTSSVAAVVCCLLVSIPIWSKNLSTEHFTGSFPAPSQEGVLSLGPSKKEKPNSGVYLFLGHGSPSFSRRGLIFFFLHLYHVWRACTTLWSFLCFENIRWTGKHVQLTKDQFGSIVLPRGWGSEDDSSDLET